MIFFKAQRRNQKRILPELIEAIQPYFDRSWEHHTREILTELSYTATDYCFVNDFIHREIIKGGWPELSGTQSFPCHESEDFFIRFNLWFPERESPVADQIKKHFSIGLLHNHRFPLFTAGLFGGGYTTRLLRWNDVSYDLKPGEMVNLDPGKELSLGLGTALYLERDSDYHVQFWPSDFSISLNIIPSRKQDFSACQYVLNDDHTIREALHSENMLRGVKRPLSKNPEA